MYNTDNFYKEMNFPKVDEKIIELLPSITEDEKLQTEIIDTKKRRYMVTTPKGMVKNAWYANKWLTNDQTKKYLLDITSVKRDDINVVRQWTWGSGTLTPHGEPGRRSMYLYLLDAGGKNVTTSWYQVPGNPVIIEFEPKFRKLTDTRNFLKLCSVVLKEKTWYYFNNSIVHGVEGIEHTRDAIAIDIYDAPRLTP